MNLRHHPEEDRSEDDQAGRRRDGQAEADRRDWEVQWVEDAASGKNLIRLGLLYALHLLADAQVSGVAVSRLDRLSRSVLDFATMPRLAKDQDWNVVVLVLDSTPCGEFGATMLMAATQPERQLISIGTKEALAAATRRELSLAPVHPLLIRSSGASQTNTRQVTGNAVP